MWVPGGAGDGRQELRRPLQALLARGRAVPSSLARCVATRLGRGGQPGLPRPQGVRKFMVEFLGGPLEKLPFGVKPQMELWSSRGHFTDYQYTEAVPDGVAGIGAPSSTWWSMARIQSRCAASSENGDEMLSETWAFQYHPF